MKFNELTAEQLMQSLALIGEAAEHVMQGGIGEDLKNELASFQAARAKAKDKAKANALAMDWAMGILTKYLPRLLRENVGDAYKLLAAMDGQTYEEYVACSNAAKVIADCAAFKKAVAKGGEVRELLAGFLA